MNINKNSPKAKPNISTICNALHSFCIVHKL